MRFNCLDDWLSWQETLNPAEIELGLDRVSAVLTRAGFSSSFDCPLITVAGTNGKGSVVAMLESMAMAAGLRVCSYTSPHLFHYNERIKINTEPVDDTVLCEAFERIDQARLDTPLTYFEFGTLAAIDIFFKEQPDLVILEVGLGGRLDAVNVMDSDVAVITSIAIDHVDWLGDNRESIGYEKAGIIRSGKTFICGDRNPPSSVLGLIENRRCDYIQIERDYDVADSKEGGQDGEVLWKLESCFDNVDGLPQPALVGEFQKYNAATAIVTLQALLAKDLLPQLNKENFIRVIADGLRKIRLSGRFEKINSEPQVYIDVAHNLQAAQGLASQISSLPALANRKNWAIVAMLADKDVAGVLEQVSNQIDCWCFSGLTQVNRGLSAGALAEIGHENIENQCTIQVQTVTEACRTVVSKVGKGDRIIIFGSFYTVAEAKRFFEK